MGTFHVRILVQVESRMESRIQHDTPDPALNPAWISGTYTSSRISHCVSRMEARTPTASRIPL